MLDASSRAGWGWRWSATTVTKLSTTLTTCQTHKLGFQRTQYKDCVITITITDIITTITDIIITNLGSQKTCYKARGRRPPSRSPLFASRPGCGDFVTLARFGLGFAKIKIEIWIWICRDIGFGQFTWAWSLENKSPSSFLFLANLKENDKNAKLSPESIHHLNNRLIQPHPQTLGPARICSRTRPAKEWKGIKYNSWGFPTSQLTSSLAGWKKSERNPFTLSKLMFPQTTTNWRWLGA